MEQAREREEAAAAERRAALTARLNRAELWRKECLAARASCQPAVSSWIIPASTEVCSPTATDKTRAYCKQDITV